MNGTLRKVWHACLPRTAYEALEPFSQRLGQRFSIGDGR
jgi:hypothetical protein